MKIVEPELLARMPDVVDPASEGDSLASKLLPWGDFVLYPILPDICGDREGGVKLVRIWLGILGLPESLNMAGPEFIVLLYSKAHRVSMMSEHA